MTRCHPSRRRAEARLLRMRLERNSRVSVRGSVDHLITLERIPVVWERRRRVGKAKRAHQSRARWAGRTEVGLARLRHSNVSKSATTDFDERAFAHPTSDSKRSKSALAANPHR